MKTARPALQSTPEVNLDPQDLLDQRFGSLAMSTHRHGTLLVDSERPEREGLLRRLVGYWQKDPAERTPTGRYEIRAWSGRALHGTRDETVYVRPDGKTITVWDLLARPANGSPMQAIEMTMELLLEARARRKQLVDQIAGLDAVEELFREGKTESHADEPRQV